MFRKLTFCLLSMYLCTYISAESPVPTTWPNDQIAAISLTFDDNHPVQIKYALREMSKRNIQGTFFIVAGNVPSWEAPWKPIDWNVARAIADSGHEVACHSVTHEYTVEEVKPAIDSFAKYFPQKKWWTWAYPVGYSDALSEVKKYCIAARQWEPEEVEDRTPSNAFLIKTIGHIAEVTDYQRAINKNGWLVETFHCISNTPDECTLGSTVELADFMRHLDTLNSLKGKFFIAPFGDVFRYAKERDNATIKQIANDSASFSFSYTDTLNNAVYNLPVTFTWTLPQGWSGCTVTQNNVKINTVFKGQSVLFSVIPDNGTITIKKTSIPTSPFNVKLWASGTPEKVPSPDLMVYLAPKNIANGSSMIICPGGGYSGLVTQQEGIQVAQWLNQQGIAGIVLPYRIGNHPIPLEDGMRAVRAVRSNCSDWGLDSSKVGMIGFSAGGHLVSTVGTHFQDKIYAQTDAIDLLSCRPSVMLLIYPVISLLSPLVHVESMNNLLGNNPSDSIVRFLSSEKQVKSSTPPTFLAHAVDDSLVPSGNSSAFYNACIANNVPAELHLYPKGGHGFYPYDSTISLWAKDGLLWLSKLGMLGGENTQNNAANLALYKKITSSSSIEVDGWGKSNLVDGVRSSIGNSYGFSSRCNGAATATEWIEVDLTKDTTLTDVTIFPRSDVQNTSGEPYSFPVDFKIDVKTSDGTIVNVYTAKNYSTSNQVSYNFHFASVKGRYVRITATRLGSTPEANCFYLQLAELEVFNSAGTNIGIKPVLKNDSMSKISIASNGNSSLIKILISQNSVQTIGLYDASGRLVLKKVIPKNNMHGVYSFVWPPADSEVYSPGLYLIKLSAPNGESVSGKFVVAR